MIPTTVPTNRAATNKLSRTLWAGRPKKCLHLLDCLAFSEQTRTTANGEVVPLAGLEPARVLAHLILSQLEIDFSTL
jgi:hypothetical protein